MTSTTLVIGASEKPSRYSNRAINMLRDYNHKVKAIGLRSGIVADVQIDTGVPEYEDIDTITMYIGYDKQEPLYDYIISLSPRRVIFNPGTENNDLSKLLTARGVEVIEFCTLIMLDRGSY